MRVFLDTNGILEIFEAKASTSLDLQELIKWGKDKTIKLITSTLVRDEVIRNRDRVIADSLASLQSGKCNFVYPSWVRELEGYGDVKDLEGQLKEKFKTLCDTASKTVQGNTLNADNVIKELYGNCEMLSVSADTVNKAVLRDRLGRDPGKPGQLGDHINWIILLEGPKEDINIIASDSDYASRLDQNKLRASLLDEYKRKTGCDAYLFKSIKAFLDSYRQHAQTVRSALYDTLCAELVSSINFSSTHGVIGKLTGQRGFSKVQLDKILEAFDDNSQVYGIIGDEDVLEFFVSLKNEVDGNADHLEKYNKMHMAYEIEDKLKAANDLPW